MQAERRLAESNVDHEYAPIDGPQNFKDLAAKLAYGADSPVIKNKLVRARAFFLRRRRAAAHLLRCDGVALSTL